MGGASESPRPTRAELDRPSSFDAGRSALLAEPAFAIAGERSISVYDACYVVLAETLDAPLVTADRRLADATANAVLV